MKLLNIAGRNFMKLSEITLPLADRGLLLIQGINDDDTSANSNGAGKSTVFELICWTLYGTTSRGLSADEVINDQAGKDCAGFLDLMDDDGAIYRIARYRKDSVEKSKVTLHRIDVTPQIDATKGTDRETQAAINKLIGCELEVFKAAVYAAQEDMPDLPGMTDKQLKLLVEEAAGITLLQEAYARAQQALADKQKAADAADNAMRNLNVEIDAVRRNVEALQGAAEQWDVGRKAAIESRKQGIIGWAEQYKQAQAALAGLDEAGWQKKRDDIAAALALRHAQLGQFSAYNNQVNQARANVQAISSQIDMICGQRVGAVNNINALQARIAQASSIVGQPCRECGKPHTAADLATVHQSLQQQIQAAEAQLKPIDEQIAQLQARKQQAQAELASVEAARPDPTAINNEIAQLTSAQQQVAAELTNIANHKSHLSQLQAVIEQADAQIKQLEAAENPQLALIKAENERLKNAQERRGAAELELVELQIKLQIAKDTAAVFSPAGIRAHILDTVTPFLNDRTSQYLGTMSDGNMTATWQTLSLTAKGEAREKFSITVKNATGAKSFAGLSGGEKRKARIACALALQDLVASRASKPLQIWLGDEIDHALDVSALERLMAILEQKARERGTVLIISHNDLADWCSNIVTVRKKGGVSRLEV